MSRPAFNASTQRLSKGPLYSQRELVLAERYLVAQGYVPMADIEGAASVRVYKHADAPATRQVVAALGDGEASGIVYFTDSEKGAGATQSTTIWDLAKKQAKTMPLADRLLRR